LLKKYIGINSGFSKDILEEIKKGNIVQDTESEIRKEEIEEFSPTHQPRWKN